jgi:hypothetical protein
MKWVRNVAYTGRKMNVCQVSVGREGTGYEI